MSRLTRAGTAKSVSRDQTLRRVRGQGNIHFPCSADHEQDWQPYPVDPYSCYMCDHTYIHTSHRTRQQRITGSHMLISGDKGQTLGPDDSLVLLLPLSLEVRTVRNKWTAGVTVQSKLG